MLKRRRKRSKGNRLEFKDLLVKLRLWRMALAALLMVAGGWLIGTQSLPYALAESHTDLALWLNSNHPAPLMRKSMDLRATLLTSAANSDAATAVKAGAAVQPDAAAAASEQDERNQLRDRITSLARRVLATEPLNAQTYQLLGEVNQNPDEVRGLMQAAVARSRRSSNAVYWLLNDSTVRGDIPQALDYADILLRSRPALGQYVVAFMGHIAESGPEGLQAVVDRLNRKPVWRKRVLGALPRSVRDLRTPRKILMALKELELKIETSEYSDYLNVLVQKQLVPFAYGTWLQLQAKEQLAQIGLLNNGDFERPSSDLPFDWKMGKSQNALTSFDAHPSRPNGRALHAVFSSSRVNYGGISQIILLAPGRYRLTGEMTGALEAKRGLQWQLICTAGKPLGTSKMINGTYPGWTDFLIEFSIPDDQQCSGQHIKLVHTSRSASEKFISGEIWFDNLSIERAKGE